MIKATQRKRARLYRYGWRFFGNNAYWTSSNANQGEGFYMLFTPMAIGSKQTLYGGVNSNGGTNDLSILADGRIEWRSHRNYGVFDNPPLEVGKPYWLFFPAISGAQKHMYLNGVYYTATSNLISQDSTSWFVYPTLSFGAYNGTTTFFTGYIWETGRANLTWKQYNHIYNEGRGVNLPLQSSYNTFSTKYGEYSTSFTYSVLFAYDKGVLPEFGGGRLAPNFHEISHRVYSDFDSYRPLLIGGTVRHPRKSIQPVDPEIKDYIFAGCQETIRGNKTGYLARYDGSTELPDSLTILDAQNNMMSGKSIITRSKLTSFNINTQAPANTNATNYASNGGLWVYHNGTLSGADGTGTSLSSFPAGSWSERNYDLLNLYGGVCEYTANFTCRSTIFTVAIYDRDSGVLLGSNTGTGGVNSSIAVSVTTRFTAPTHGRIRVRVTADSYNGSGVSIRLNTDSYSWFNSIVWSGQQNALSYFWADSSKLAELQFNDVSLTIDDFRASSNSLKKLSDIFKPGIKFPNLAIVTTNQFAEDNFTFPEDVKILYLSSASINTIGQTGAGTIANLSFINFQGNNGAIYASGSKLTGKVTLPTTGDFNIIILTNNTLNCNLSDIFGSLTAGFKVNFNTSSYFAIGRNQLYSTNFVFPGITLRSLLLSDAQSTSSWQGQTGAGNNENLSLVNVLGLATFYANRCKLTGVLILPAQQMGITIEIGQNDGLTLVDNIPATAQLLFIQGSAAGLGSLAGDITALYLSKSSVFTNVRLDNNQLTGAIKAVYNYAHVWLGAANNKLRGQTLGETINHIITDAKLAGLSLSGQSGAGNSTLDLSGNKDNMLPLYISNMGLTYLKLSDTVSTIQDFQVQNNPGLTSIDFASVTFPSNTGVQRNFYGGNTTYSSQFIANGCGLNMLFPIGSIIKSRLISIQDNGMSQANVDATIDHIILNAGGLVSGTTVNMGGTNAAISEAKIPALLDLIETSGVTITINTPAGRTYGKLVRIARTLDGASVTATNQIWVESTYNAWSGQLNQQFTITGTTQYDGVWTFGGSVVGGTFKARLAKTGFDNTSVTEETGVFYKN